MDQRTTYPLSNLYTMVDCPGPKVKRSNEESLTTWPWMFFSRASIWFWGPSRGAINKECLKWFWTIYLGWKVTEYKRKITKM